MDTHTVAYHPGPVDGSLLSQQSEHRSELIWNDTELSHFRLRVNFSDYWTSVGLVPPAADVVRAIRDAGFDGVYNIGTLRHDAGLITAFVERWRPETHTFHLRFGEATITLEDVHHILGLRTTGDPVIHDEDRISLDDCRRTIGELLGVYPDDTVVNRAGIKISWMVQHFGGCERLDEYADGYDGELIFHTRAHLLLIIGSLFPSPSGNRIQFSLLHYVEDLTRIRSYSWGSAALAYLYRSLCSSSIGAKTDLCGCMTLLQVWIWERFPSLAPTITEDAIFQYPLALRWKGPMSRTSVPRSQARIFRYELDTMTAEHFLWTPYSDLPSTCLPNRTVQRHWTSRCPLLFISVAEWCYPDRVTRQFGRIQDIPRSSPHESHDRLHERVNDRLGWLTVRHQYIHLWETRMTQALLTSWYPIGIGCTEDYDDWYDSVTRRFIVNPTHWASQPGFQGTQGVSQYYAEGISDAYDAISAPTPDVDSTQHILADRMTTTEMTVGARRRGSRRHIPTGRRTGRPRDVYVEPEIGTYYGHAFGDAHVFPFTGRTSQDGGWDRWIEPTTREVTQDYFQSGGGSQDFSQRHPPIDLGGGSQHHGGGFQESFIPSSPITGGGTEYHGGGSSQHRSPPPHYQVTEVGSSQFESPMHGFTEFGDGGSALDEHGDDIPQRLQPHREAKGKGRRCFTGSHILPH